MSEDNRPRILIVDDEDTTRHQIGLDLLAVTRGLHPHDIESGDLEWADLVLMDYILANWPQRDQLDSISLQPINGLALAAILRENVDRRNGDEHCYTAFAIHTAHIGDISKRLHTTNKTPNVVARLNNLEWTFDKADPSRFRCAADLAQAVREVSAAWADVNLGGIKVAASRLLKLPPDQAWSKQAEDDLVLGQIPLSQFSSGTNGLLFLRWLLQGILPYPTFLLEKHWVASRLRITPDSLEMALKKSHSKFTQELGGCRYNGTLASFSGPRWWRAAIDQYAWDIRAAGDRDPDRFHAALEERAETSLAQVVEISPVVCVDRELKPGSTLLSLDAVVRLVPDLWPGYADPAYAELSLARADSDLRSIVHPLDQERVICPEGEEDD